MMIEWVFLLSYPLCLGSSSCFFYTFSSLCLLSSCCFFCQISPLLSSPLFCRWWNCLSPYIIWNMSWWSRTCEELGIITSRPYCLFLYAHYFLYMLTVFMMPLCSKFLIKWWLTCFWGLYLYYYYYYSFCELVWTWLMAIFFTSTRKWTLAMLFSTGRNLVNLMTLVRKNMLCKHV